jgi:hypothetical protein
MTAYNRYLLDLSSEIPAINANGYIGSDGKYYTFSDESVYEDKLSEYEMIQYNYMFDKKKDEKYFTVD